MCVDVGCIYMFVDDVFEVGFIVGFEYCWVVVVYMVVVGQGIGCFIDQVFQQCFVCEQWCMVDVCVSYVGYIEQYVVQWLFCGIVDDFLQCGEIVVFLCVQYYQFVVQVQVVYWQLLDCLYYFGKIIGLVQVVV